MRLSKRVSALIVAVSLIPVSVLITTATSATPSGDFITEWTLNSTDTITLPLYSAGTYNFTVDWTSDGTIDGTVTSDNDPDAVSPVLGAGTHTVTISGDLEGWNFNEQDTSVALITDVKQWGNVKLGNETAYFYDAENLDISATDAPDLSNTTDLTEMFVNAYALTTPDFSAWDTSKVTRFSDMFLDASSFNGNVDNWDVSSGTSFSGMFEAASVFNRDIGYWDVLSGTSFSSMFEDAGLFNGDIGYWDVSSGTGFSSMFRDAGLFNGDIGYWDVSSGRVFNDMFRGATSFNSDISYWNTSKATQMPAMFYGATSFNRDIGYWDVSNVTEMQSMFKGATSFNQDIGYWDVRAVKESQAMFQNATTFNQDIGYWSFDSMGTKTCGSSSTRNCIRNMFNGASNFAQNLSYWEFCMSDPGNFSTGSAMTGTPVWSSVNVNIICTAPSPANSRSSVQAAQASRGTIAHFMINYVTPTGRKQSYPWVYDSVKLIGTSTATLPVPSVSSMTFTGWYSKNSLINGQTASAVGSDPNDEVFAGIIPSELAQVLGLP